jgi:hypothetical protein
MLNVLDEFTHECLAIRVARKLKAIDVIDVLSDLCIPAQLNGEIFYTLREAQISEIAPELTDTSHQHQRCSCPHSPRGRLRRPAPPATLAQRPTLN